MISSPSVSPIILLVEDSDDDAFFFSRLLKKCGYADRYIRLSDGRSALEYLAKSGLDSKESEGITDGKGAARPDLIFLDLKLPTVSGFEVLEWITAQKFAIRFDLTVLSGSDQLTDMKRAAALGASDYLVKPIRLEQLRSRLEAWQRRSGQAAASPAEMV